MGKKKAVGTIQKAKTTMVDSQIGSVEPCESASLRAKDRLKKHKEDIEAHREKYIDERDKAIKGHRKKSIVGAAKAKITEATGEEAATKYMRKNHPEYELVSGFVPGTGFDQVYVKRDKNGKIEEYLIVEAKGPGAKLLKTKKKGLQMSKQWVLKNAQELRASKDPYDSQLGENIYDAILDGPPPKISGKILAVAKNETEAKEIVPPPPTKGKYNY